MQILPEMIRCYGLVFMYIDRDKYLFFSVLRGVIGAEFSAGAVYRLFLYRIAMRY